MVSKLNWSAFVLIAIIIVCYKSQKQASVPSPVFYVVSSNESRPSWCVSNKTHCHTLDEYVIDGTLNISHSNFVFLNGTHQLNQSLMVYDSANLTLQGSLEGNSSVQIVCESMWNIAVSFTRVSSLTIQNISFLDCSYNNSFTGPTKTEYVISALHFEGGSDLTLSDVKILNGGFSIINTQGRVEITRMNVTSYFHIHRENKANKTSEQSFGGSYVQYFTCHPQDSLTIVESNFQFYNTNETHLNHSRLLDKYSSHGLSLVSNCTNLQITVANSNFYGFKSFSKGGNLMILFQKSCYALPTRPNKSMVTISQCRVVAGHALQGGGAFISLVQPFLQEESNALSSIYPQKLLILSISDSEFVNNSALGGGALNVKVKEFSRFNVEGYVQVERCTFSGNYLKEEQSHGGIALQMSSFLMTPSTRHYTPSFYITFRNCSFYDNYMKGDRRCTPGNGVLNIVKTSHFHIIDSEFTQNHCTAIKSIGSNLVLEGEVYITNNSGSSGGGLLLCDDSMMILKPNTQVRIVNNSVVHTGGGITVESQCLQTRPMCFFQLSSEITYNSSLLDTVTIELFNNSARYAGDNLFGGSIDYCYLVHPPRYKGRFLSPMYMFNKTFVNIKITNSSVTSIARKICFCDHDKKNCSKRSLTVHVYPGEMFKVSVVPVGQLSGTVPASVRAQSNKLKHSDLIQNIGKSKCKTLEYTVMSNKAVENIDLHIQHEGDISGYIKSSLFKAAKMKVILKPCPTGFQLTKEKSHHYKCTCDQILYYKDGQDGKVSCDIEDQTIKKQSWLWIGFIQDPYENNRSSEKQLIAKTCPLDYCDTTLTTNRVTLSDRFAQDTQCQFNRTGILCGTCGQNFSVILGSSECWSCSSMSLFLLVFFALAGVLLIILLTVCDLTISEGKISGLIFYANIVHISDTLFIPQKTPKLDFASVLRTVIAWINLDLGVQACFYNGMDAYAKAWLQFAFPLYLWLLSGLIVFLCNRYISVTRLFGTNSVRVLATVILLSFTKLLRAVITTLSCLNVHLYENNNINKTRSLWTSDPNIPCLRGKHVPLFAFGLIFSVVWIVFIVFVLFIQCWPRLRCCSWMQRLKPFTDSFTGPNTSHGRFWTGLLLLSRLAIAIAYGRYGNSIYTKYYYTCATGVSICLLLVAACLPSGVYNKRSTNILESFFILNLLFTVFAAGIDLHTFNIHVSVSLALVTFMGILIFHWWRKLKHTHCVTLLRGKLKTIFTKLQLERSEGIVINSDSAFPKYCAFDEDREPLLASSASYH